MVSQDIPRSPSPPSPSAPGPEGVPEEGKSAENPPLLESRAEGVATLTLNRPAARNALSRGLMRALQEAIDAIARDESVRAVIIAGNGPAFCAGHDLREMRTHPDAAFTAALFQECSHLMLSLTSLPKPVIARVHGMATAAGCQLVASCDLAIASTEARFATPGVNIGLFCSTPMVALSRTIGQKAAMEMLLTGEAVDAATAAQLGLVNRVVAAADLETAATDLARRLAEKSPLTLAIGKEAFYHQLSLPLREAYEYASAVMTRNMMSEDAGEGIDAFLAKRPPHWRGR